MDAAAQLALMTKAKIIFEKPGTFLSFPALVPIAFTPAVLDFGKALSDPKISTALLDFSRMVNQCPTGVIFRGDSDQYLWDHYDYWLSTMAVAQDELTADQDTAYIQAQALLTKTDASGLLVDSVNVSTYKQYRDQYITAEQAYKVAATTASMSTDPTVSARWWAADEPRLREIVAKVMADWTTKGNKAAIEAAQAKVASYQAKMPRKMWMQWRAAYNPDLDLFTDAASNTSCGPTGFAPSNVFVQPWTTFTLSTDEMRGLAAQAPKELQVIFAETGASEIASISFDFCSVAVVRPWFNSAIFKARFWKFDDVKSNLSNGGTPPQGAWPSYITAVIFVRNMRVTKVSAPQAAPQPVHTIPPMVFRPEVLHTLQIQQAVPVARPRFMMMAMPAMAALPAVRLAPVAAESIKPAGAVGHAVVPQRTTMVNPALRLDAAMYKVPPIFHGPVAVQPAPADPQPDDQVSILAFICQPLPKVPDPDPTLIW